MLGVSNVYKCRPSELLDIKDTYTSYCFDEACAYIIGKLENGETPMFMKHYSSFTDLYKKYN